MENEELQATIEYLHKALDYFEKMFEEKKEATNETPVFDKAQEEAQTIEADDVKLGDSLYKSIEMDLAGKKIYLKGGKDIAYPVIKTDNITIKTPSVEETPVQEEVSLPVEENVVAEVSPVDAPADEVEVAPVEVAPIEESVPVEDTPVTEVSEEAVIPTVDTTVSEPVQEVAAPAEITPVDAAPVQEQTSEVVTPVTDMVNEATQPDAIQPAVGLEEEPAKVLSKL